MSGVWLGLVCVHVCFCVWMCVCEIVYLHISVCVVCGTVRYVCMSGSACVCVCV